MNSSNSTVRSGSARVIPGAVSMAVPKPDTLSRRYPARREWLNPFLRDDSDYDYAELPPLSEAPTLIRNPGEAGKEYNWNTFRKYNNDLKRMNVSYADRQKRLKEWIGQLGEGKPAGRGVLGAIAAPLRAMGLSKGGSAMSEKRADSVKDQLKFQIKAIANILKQNPLSRKELIRSALTGAAVTGVAGAGIGALTGKKGKRRKRAIMGAIMGAIGGGAIGPLVSQYNKFMAGVPFDNSRFDKADHPKGQKVYIGVAGSANGENESWFADEMRARFPGRAYMLRWGDWDKLNEVYDKLKGEGLDVTIVGHSSGGKTAARFLNEHPEVKGYLIDPVSWLGRKIPGNATVFTADKSTRHGNVPENTIADLGGRWNYEGGRSVVFKGSHSDRLKDIIRDFVDKGVSPETGSASVPHYVTNMFGKNVNGG